MVSATFSPVLTGTVLLSTTTLYEVIALAMSRATRSMKLRSTEPSSSGGVGTAMKMTSDFSTPSAVLAVKLSRPAATFFLTISSSPGSKIGMPPSCSSLTLASSQSTQMTLWPTSAKQVPVTKPT